MKLERVLIVGGGIAGLHTARLLRENGYAGAVTLLGAEMHRPYDRPPLSKQVLDGRLEMVGELAFPFDFEALGVETRFGERAVGWKPGGVTTSGGDVLRYDALVIATGSEPLRLPFDSAKAQTLRTHERAARLRDGLHPGRHLPLVGAC